jgi:hypothetical protein
VSLWSHWQNKISLIYLNISDEHEMTQKMFHHQTFLCLSVGIQMSWKIFLFDHLELQKNAVSSSRRPTQIYFPIENLWQVKHWGKVCQKRTAKEMDLFSGILHFRFFASNTKITRRYHIVRTTLTLLNVDVSILSKESVIWIQIKKRRWK